MQYDEILEMIITELTERVKSNSFNNKFRLFILLFYSRSNSNKVVIIFDHTTLDDRFLILQFSFKYEVLLLADIGFKSIDLFKYIDELGWKYCIRYTNDMIVKIEGNEKVRYLKDINPIKNRVKKLNNILLGEKEYKCNLAVCRAVDSEDTWYLATNMNSRNAVNEYKKRFDIEEMFRGLFLVP